MMEAKLDRLECDISQLKLWVIGTAAATFLGTAGLVYSVASFTGSTMQTALAAIQTVVAAKPPEPPHAPPPTVIIVPSREMVRAGMGGTE